MINWGSATNDEHVHVRACPLGTVCGGHSFWLTRSMSLALRHGQLQQLQLQQQHQQQLLQLLLQLLQLQQQRRITTTTNKQMSYANEAGHTRCCWLIYANIIICAMPRVYWK